MGREIKCLHCAAVFLEPKAYVVHCNERHADVVREIVPKQPQVEEPKPPKPPKPKKPREAKPASKPKKPKKQPKVAEVAANYRPARDKKQQVKLRYDHWISVRNTWDGRPWHCKSCGQAFPTYQETLTHLRSKHSQQVFDYSKRKAELGRPKRTASTGSVAKGVFSGYGMSAGWAIPMGGGLPGLGKNR